MYIAIIKDFRHIYIGIMKDFVLAVKQKKDFVLNKIVFAFIVQLIQDQVRELGCVVRL
jgi:hypothetical protein